jgi:hypothetical protein
MSVTKNRGCPVGSLMLKQNCNHLFDGMSVFSVEQVDIDPERKGQRGQYAKHSSSVILRN